MIFYLVVLAIFASFSDGAAIEEFRQARGLSDSLKEYLENIKKQLPCGFPEQGIPPLAPLKIDHEEFSLQESWMSANAELRDFILTGLDNYDVIKTDLSVGLTKATIDFDVNFNKIHALGQYALDAYLNKTAQIVAAGDLDFSVEDFRIKGNVQLKIKLSGVQIGSFHVVVSLGNVHSDITGLAGEGLANEFANRFVEKFLMDFVANNQEEISKEIHDFAVPMVDDILSEYSLWDIIKMITRPGEPVVCNPEEN